MEQFLNSFRKLTLMKFKVSSGLNIQATALGNPDDPLVIYFMEAVKQDTPGEELLRNYLKQDSML